MRELSTDDIDWVVDRLAARRRRLVPFAPVYWRPAADAIEVHRRFLTRLLTELGGHGVRTDSALMIAAPDRRGWTIDDADVATDDDWDGAGHEMWRALSRSLGGQPVRFVCPVPEPARLDFAHSLGFETAESWWHIEVPPEGVPQRGDKPHVDAATALGVPAPPIYDPGGPVLFLPALADAPRALPSARTEALRIGCPLVVVSQRADDDALARVLETAGYRRHCDFADNADYTAA